MGIEREKIKRVQDQVQDSDLGIGHKEALDDMLLATYKATNGAPDKIQALTEAVSSLGVCVARDAIHRRDDFREIIDEALAKHKQDCPLNRKPQDGSTVPEIDANLKAGTFKARGTGAMGPIARIIAYVILGSVAVALVHQLSVISGEMRDLKAAIHAPSK